MWKWRIYEAWPLKIQAYGYLFRNEVWNNLEQLMDT